MTVPLETAVGGSPTRTVGVWDGSAGEFTSRFLPKGAKLVSAFNNVSAELLNDISKQVDCDVLVCGDDADAKKVVLDLAKAIPGVRGVDAGPLSNSRTIEQLTALLVSLRKAERGKKHLLQRCYSDSCAHCELSFYDDKAKQGHLVSPNEMRLQGSWSSRSAS